MERDNTANKDFERLYRLNELSDYEVADHNPDVRGWEVRGEGGCRLGIVEELIVSKEDEKVRYLDVELESDMKNQTGKNHLLMPVGMARLHDKDDVVEMPDVNPELAKACPDYSGGPVRREYERDLMRSLNRGQEHTQPHFYEHPHFDERQFWGARWSQSAGEAPTLHSLRRRRGDRG